MTRCQVSDLLKAEGIGDDEMQLLMDYFARFQKPQGYNCQCGAKLTGIFGSFEWGITNGEGFCSSCGWPVRMLHRLPESRGMLTFPLMYHEDEVEERP